MDLVSSGVVVPAECSETLGERAAQEMAGDEQTVELAGRLMSRASSISEVRYERVAALRLAIEGGTYAVGAEDLAERLMRDMER